MVDIRLLQAAIVVAEERSVTRAADRLGLTQPALSKQLAELEDRVGFVLFERSSQRFEITSGGASFVEHARIAIAEIERAVQSGRAAVVGHDDVLCIAKSPYVDPYFASVMRTVRLPLYPKLQLRFSSHFSADALRLLRSGDAEMALVTTLGEPSGFTSTKLAEEPLYAIFPTGDPLCLKRDLQLRDLHDRRCALFERQVNPSIYDKFQQLLAAEHIQLSEVQHVQQAEEAAVLVLQRGSIGLLTKTGAWRVSNTLISMRPLSDERLLLRTYLTARLDEDSRLIAEFTRAFAKRLAPVPEQTKLALAG